MKERKLSYLGAAQAIYHGCDSLTVLLLNEPVLLYSHQLSKQTQSPLLCYWYRLLGQLCPDSPGAVFLRVIKVSQSPKVSYVPTGC